MLVCVLGMLPLYADTHRYVDANSGDNSNSGTSSGDAWQTITHALSETSGMGTSTNQVIIHVANGTYSNNMGGGVGETFPLQPRRYNTIEGESEQDTRIVAPGYGSTSVFRVVNRREEIYLKHLNISGGYSYNGGGIYMDSATLDVEACIIENNDSYGQQYMYDPKGCGGGIFCIDDTYLYISDSVITNNDCVSNSWGGGGIYFGHNSGGVVSGCEITYNYARRGAGVFCDVGSSVRFVACNIDHNDAAKYGGGMWCFDGSSPSIEDCTINHNTAIESFGGLGGHTGCSPFVVNTEISYNRLLGYGTQAGSGMCFGTDCAPVFLDCKINYNIDSFRGGGAYFATRCRASFHNCEFIGNVADKESSPRGGAICASLTSHIRLRNLSLINI